MTTNDANAEILWVQDVTRDIYTEQSAENREMSKIEAMCDMAQLFLDLTIAFHF